MIRGGTVIHDGCLKQVRRFGSTTVTQRKRRPDRFRDKPDECSWVLPCPDHPKKDRARNLPAG